MSIKRINLKNQFKMTVHIKAVYGRISIGFIVSLGALSIFSRGGAPVGFWGQPVKAPRSRRLAVKIMRK